MSKFNEEGRAVGNNFSKVKTPFWSQSSVVSGREHIRFVGKEESP